MSLIFIPLTKIRCDSGLLQRSKFKDQSKSNNKVTRRKSYEFNFYSLRKFSDKHRKTIIGPKSNEYLNFLKICLIQI